MTQPIWMFVVNDDESGNVAVRLFAARQGAEAAFVERCQVEWDKFKEVNPNWLMPMTFGDAQLFAANRLAPRSLYLDIEIGEVNP